MTLAEEYGLPPTIPIPDSKRDPHCDAHSAILTSVEGEYAIYQGVCQNRHKYMERVKIQKQEDIKEQIDQLVVEDGEIKHGTGSGYKAQDLEEY